MNSIFKSIYLLLLLSLLIFSCKTTDPLSGVEIKRNESFIVWAHSDIQPEKDSEKEFYELAVDDMKSLSFVPDMALVAGDLVYRKNSQNYWKWQKKLRRKSGIRHWFEIAGNHDHNDTVSYLHNSGKPLHYAVLHGNVLFIMLSDETKSAITNISNEAFEWWKGLVKNNRDKIIVTVTHGSLAQSELLSTVNWTMCIKDSHRFWNFLKDYPVDLWISGHTHLPNFLPIKTTKPYDRQTRFLDISSIHKKTGTPVESWILMFKNGSDKLICAARDHEDKKFYSTSFEHKLSRPFVNSGKKPVVISELHIDMAKEN